MFAVLYQGYVKDGREMEYRQAWHKVLRYFVDKRGALGSTLHRTESGLWVGYTCWPDKATREASWPDSETLPEEIRKAIAAMKDCLDEQRQLPDVHMEVVENIQRGKP
jgi:hypothetical protein